MCGWLWVRSIWPCQARSRQAETAHPLNASITQPFKEPDRLRFLGNIILMSVKSAALPPKFSPKHTKHLSLAGDESTLIEISESEA